MARLGQRWTSRRAVEVILPFPRAAAWRAAEKLPNQHALDSAKTGLSKDQKSWSARAIALPAIGWLLTPGATLNITIFGLTLLFMCLIAWRLALTLIGLAVQHRGPHCGPDCALPVYTLLIPLYDEPGAVPGLAAALNGLDWPAQKLDVKLLIEAADTATRDAIAGANWPAGTEILPLAPGTPRTKPRALNFGLERARGDYVAIYDAEDRPSADQLRDVVKAFACAHPRCACIQAPLVAYNDAASWVSGQWALEYAMQFGLFVPALCALGAPVPLGGTSNHFRRDILEELCGWDAWNVTEDADLGMRLARLGYRVGHIRSPTLEEAPETLGIWTAQRSRWIKGYIQTWIVMWRQPAAMLAGMGVWRMIAAQLTLGGAIVSALLHGPLALLVLSGVVFGHVQLPPAALGLCMAGYLVNAFAALCAPGRRRGRAWRIVTLPLYWPLQSLAAVRALAELITRPHAWAKTPHGLTRCEAILTQRRLDA